MQMVSIKHMSLRYHSRSVAIIDVKLHVQPDDYFTVSAA